MAATPTSDALGPVPGSRQRRIIIDNLLHRHIRCPRWGAVAGIALVALVLLPMVARALPQTFTARFTMNAQGMDIARSQWHLQRSAKGEFLYTTRSESIGIAKLLRNEQVEESSRFIVDGAVLRPLRYEYTRSGGKRHRTASVQFDWSTGQALNRINDDSWTLPLSAGVQDKLSYTLAIMLAMEQDGAPPASITVTDGGKAKTYALAVVGREKRATVLGDLDTVHIKRSTSDDPRVTHIWLASGLGFLPVHIEHMEDGETATFTLDSLDGLSPR